MDKHEDEFEKLAKEAGLRGEFRFGMARKSPPDETWYPLHNWRVKLQLKGRQLTVDFFGGELVENPSPSDVLRALCMDARCASESFEEFCESLGYDPNPNTKKLYHACEKIAVKLERFLGPLYEKFMESC